MRNFQKELDKIINDQTGEIKKILVHSCCAPCSTYVIEYLSSYFEVTVFYYNPNITDDDEYHMRAKEQKRLIDTMTTVHPVNYVEGNYEKKDFFHAINGLEKCREGEERCFACFELRLEETAKIAKQGKYDFFTTTLTISPLKNAEILNEIGERLGMIYDIPFLPSDFKKKNGYKRSTELSKEFGLYRQDYCGCVYSKIQREQEMKDRGI